MEANNSKFEKALVIFIDILGSQSRKSFNEQYKINSLFHNELLENKNNNKDYLAYQRHIYTFSDCAYIIYDYKDKSTDHLGELFNVAFSNCEMLFMKLLSHEIIFRGGTAFGDVFYENDKNMFFGEAINRAYQYESTVAKYPRIVVDNYIANEVIKIQTDNIVKLDKDGTYYINYFNSIQQGIDCSQIIHQTNREFTQNIINLCKKQIRKHRKYDNVRSKYEWLKRVAEQALPIKASGWKHSPRQNIFDEEALMEYVKSKNLLVMPNNAPIYSDMDELKVDCFGINEELLKFVKAGKNKEKKNKE